MSSYKVLNTGLDLGTRFLSPYSAYFLGLLTSDEQLIIKNRTFWSASVRHNPSFISNENLEHHYNLVRDIAKSINKLQDIHMADFYKRQGYPLPRFNAGKVGFSTLFMQNESSYSIDNLVNDISIVIQDSPLELIQAFLVGVFDGRSSYDKTAKFISLDLELGAAKELITLMLDHLEIQYNYNDKATARKRENINSRPRKPQLRIKRDIFLPKIGYVSPARFEVALNQLDPGSFIIEQSSSILPEIKTIRFR